MNFNELGLAAPILKALAGEGYTVPTPIQAQAIPAVMAGRDLLGIAQTGTGKTAAFALPILHRLAAEPPAARRKAAACWCSRRPANSPPRSRESFRTYGRNLGVTVAVIFGGVEHGPQIKALARGVDILVATPGRLLDHLRERSVVLSETRDLRARRGRPDARPGLPQPIRKHRRQAAEASARTCSSRPPCRARSASWPATCCAIRSRSRSRPQATTVERVNQRVIHVERSQEAALLAELFADPDLTRALVFTRTKRGADRVSPIISTAAGIAAAAIHGDKSQGQRERGPGSLQGRRSPRAGRHRHRRARHRHRRVSHVVNFELPDVPEAYVHRIGRTARAGAEGIAISLCDSEERDLLRDIERLTRQSIPSENRRGDASIAADQGVAERSSQGRGRSGGGQSQGRGRDASRGGGGRNGSGAGAGRSQQRPARGNAQHADRSGARDKAERPTGPRPVMSERAYAERAPAWEHERPKSQVAARQAAGERSHAERAKLADSNGGWRKPDDAGSGGRGQKQHTGNRKKYKPARQWSAPASTA